MSQQSRVRGLIKAQALPFASHTAYSVFILLFCYLLLFNPTQSKTQNKTQERIERQIYTRKTGIERKHSIITQYRYTL